MKNTDPRVSVVVLTHERPQELERTLRHLEALPEAPPLIVVDNGASPATAEVVRRFQRAQLVCCPGNLGAAGRNHGMERVRTPYVAFCDDDTWWEPGALARAAAVLDMYPHLGLLNAQVLVGPENRVDPACERMASSPLDSRGLPGARLVSFMAGAVVMRAQAFREAGGYEPRFFLGAEEVLLSQDLMAAGWDMAYVPAVQTHHHPSPARDRRARHLATTRNRFWLAWLRLPWRLAWHETRKVWRDGQAQGVLGPALRAALAGLAWALARRRVLPPPVVEMIVKVHGGPPPVRRRRRLAVMRGAQR
jgi:GT2 family glycosyltransferase